MNKSQISKIVLVVIIATIIVGGAVFLWQNRTLKLIQSKNLDYYVKNYEKFPFVLPKNQFMLITNKKGQSLVKVFLLGFEKCSPDSEGMTWCAPGYEDYFSSLALLSDENWSDGKIHEFYMEFGIEGPPLYYGPFHNNVLRLSQEAVQREDFIKFGPYDTQRLVQNIENKKEAIKPKEPLKVIEDYYGLITSGKLKEAYEMHQYLKVSFEQFEKWYKNIFYVRPNTWNVKKIKGNTYQFLVDISGNDKPVERYQVVMEVDNNKINTISSKQIAGGKATFGNLSAYIVMKKDNIYIILKKNNIEEKIYTGDYEEGGFLYIGNLRFSPKGNYLIYEGINESAPDYTFLYDIENKGELKFPSLQTLIFTPDEGYFFACAYTEMDPVFYGEVYRLHSSQPQYDVVKDAAIMKDALFNNDSFDCEYDVNKRVLRYIFNDYDKVKAVVEYSLDTGKSIIVK